MAFFDTLKNIGSNIIDYFNAPTRQEQLNKSLTATIGENLSPQQTLRAEELVSGRIQGPTVRQATGKLPGLYEYELSKISPQIRPIITTRLPSPPPPPPLPSPIPYVAPGQTGSFVTPEERIRREEQRKIEQQGKVGQAGISTQQSFGGTQQAQQGVIGSGGLTSGTSRGQNVAGGVGGPNLSGIPSEEKPKKTTKQPQFT